MCCSQTNTHADYRSLSPLFVRGPSRASSRSRRGGKPASRRIHRVSITVGLDELFAFKRSVKRAISALSEEEATLEGDGEDGEYGEGSEEEVEDYQGDVLASDENDATLDVKISVAADAGEDATSDAGVEARAGSKIDTLKEKNIKEENKRAKRTTDVAERAMLASDVSSPILGSGRKYKGAATEVAGLAGRKRSLTHPLGPNQREDDNEDDDGGGDDDHNHFDYDDHGATAQKPKPRGVTRQDSILRRETNFKKKASSMPNVKNQGEVTEKKHALIQHKMSATRGLGLDTKRSNISLLSRKSRHVLESTSRHDLEVQRGHLSNVGLEKQTRWVNKRRPDLCRACG